MKLLELQNILGERIRITTDDTLEQVQQDVERRKSETVALLAKNMIANANIILQTDKVKRSGEVTATLVEKLI